MERGVVAELAWWLAAEEGVAGYREAEVGWLMEGTAELGPQDVPSGWALVQDGARQMGVLCTGMAGLAGKGLTGSRN